MLKDVIITHVLEIKCHRINWIFDGVWKHIDIEIFIPD